MNAAIELDIGPLTWVKGEIDLALDRAGEAMRQFAALPAGADGKQGAQIKQARNQLRQARGALAIVGLEGVTQFAESLEALFAGLEEGAIAATPAAIEAAQQGLTAIRQYLDDLVDGHPDQPLRLLPSYRPLQLARGLAEPEPAELFFPDLSLRPPRREKEPPPLSREAQLARIKAARLGFQRGLLKWLKGETKGAKEMRVAMAMIEMVQGQPGARAFWWAAMAFFDGLAEGGIAVDARVKKLCGRIDAQVKKLLDGADDVADRLMRDVLYFVATASHGGDHLECVQAAYRLDGLVPSASMARDIATLKPVLRSGRELLTATKDHWNRYCAGTTAALGQFHEGALQLARRLAELSDARITRLADAIGATATLLRNEPSRQGEAIALEVATALLLLEGALENFPELGDEFTHQVDTVAERLALAARGQALSALEIPHLDEMSRKAQERLLMHQVAKEILVNLANVEQTLDAFFRDPMQRGGLGQLTRPLGQITGALTVLGQDRAVAVLRECELMIIDFRDDTYVPRQEDFESVATKLSALGFFVEKLQFGPADIDAILHPAPAVAPREEVATPAVVPAIEPAPTQAQPPAIPAEVAVEPLREETQSEPSPEPGQPLEIPHEDIHPVDAGKLDEQAGAVIAALEAETAVGGAAVTAAPVEATAVPAPSAEAARLVEASSAEIDAELLAIFLEEAHEVLGTISEHLPRLAAQPRDVELLTVLRRSFHTLKGSGRMVGLNDLGEAAWSVEQTLNKWLQQEKAASTDLLDMLDGADWLFSDWIAQLETGGSAERDASDLTLWCDRLRNEEVVEEPATAPSTPAPFEEPADLPAAEFAATEAFDLPFELPPPAPELPAPPPPPEPMVPEVVEVVRIGELEISPILFELYVDEALGHVATLQGGFGQAGISAEQVRVAHTLAGISAATGLIPVQSLAHALENALDRFLRLDAVPNESQRLLLARAVGALEGMVGAVAEKRMPSGEAALSEQVEALAPTPVLVVAPPPLSQEAVAAPEPVTAAVPLPPTFSAPAPAAPAAPVMAAPTAAATQAARADEEAAAAERRQLRIHDDIDAQLLPIFLEEAQELMAGIGGELRSWREAPDDTGISGQIRRLLHTLKGSGRMAGAMSVGELVHGLETRIEVTGKVTPAFIDEVEATHDRVAVLIDNLRRHGRVDVPAAAGAPVAVPGVETGAKSTTTETTEERAIVAPTVPTVPIPAGEAEAVARPTLRVRADLLDKVVNEAGEMALARARIEGEMRTLKSSLLDLTENVIRLRGQLREIEIQAETQMQSQMMQLKAEAAEQNRDFDPLEFDRFTRFQELTRMMAESVNDVASVQHNLLQNLDHANAALVAQSRLNRELSQALMSVRMVPFNTVAERLYRIVRQTAKELDKRANLDVRGGQTELDRSVLEAMIGPIEHLLRNAVVHGLEDRAARAAAGKPEIGEIQLSLAQAGNEILIEMTDDGAGLDLDRIRARAIERGQLAADAEIADADIAAIIFQPGFSTATEVTEVAGRGVGLDVVSTETANLGGRIEIDAGRGRGARFRIYLPLTLAVTQAVLVRAGSHAYAIPSTMIEQVSELKPEVIALIREAGGTDWLGNHYPWHYIGQLLGDADARPQAARRHWLMLLKGASRHIALEVDGLVGNEEIVVKNIGPQLARVVGIDGATVLSNGEIALILNPIALSGRQPANRMVQLTQTTISRVSEAEAIAATPTVMVVDDSLTVRKIAGRLLAREGYHVLTAKDGVDALEQLAEVVPDVMLVDIEMPRMDGFDLTRNVRADVRTRGVPIIMITSRIADKHRNYAMEIGVNHYLGKPYDEEELLGLIAGYVKGRAASR